METLLILSYFLKMVGRTLQVKAMEDDSMLFSSLLDLCDSEMISVGDIEIVCSDGQKVYLHKIVFNFAYPHLTDILPNDQSSTVIIIPECDSETAISARNALYLDGDPKPLQTILENGLGEHVPKLECKENNDDNSVVDDEQHKDENGDQTNPLNKIYKDESIQKEQNDSWITVDKFIGVDKFDKKNKDVTDDKEKTMPYNTKKTIGMALKTYNLTMDLLLNENLPKYGNILMKLRIMNWLRISASSLKLLLNYGSFYNPGSLRAFLTGLNHHLSFRDRDIDIKRDRRFWKVWDILKARSREIEKMGELPGIHGSTPLREEDLEKALSSGTMGRSNPLSLVTLVYYNLLCASPYVEETTKLLNGDFEYGPTNENGFPEYIAFSHKVRSSEEIIKSYVTPDSKRPVFCPVQNILFYMSKKTPEQSRADQPFFLMLNLNAIEHPEERKWFLDQKLGFNSFRALLRNALIKAGVNLEGQKITSKSVWKSQKKEKIKIVTLREPFDTSKR